MSAGEMFIAGRRPSIPGANTQILYNSQGVEGANVNLTFNVATSTLNVGGNLNVNVGYASIVAANSGAFIGNVLHMPLTLVANDTTGTGNVGVDFTDNQLVKARIAVQMNGGGSYMSLGTSNNYNNGITQAGLILDPSGSVNVGVGTLVVDAIHDNANVTGNLLASIALGVNIGATAPLTEIDTRGIITAGRGIDTTGQLLLVGYRGAGNTESLTTFGTTRSAGGPLIGYAVMANGNAPSTLDFLSTTSLAEGRSVITCNGTVIFFAVGASQTVSVGAPVTIAEVLRLTTTGANVTGQLNVNNQSWMVGDMNANPSLTIHNTNVADGRVVVSFIQDKSTTQRWDMGIDPSGGVTKSWALRDITSAGSPTRFSVSNTGIVSVPGDLNVTGNANVTGNVYAQNFQGINANVVVFNPSIYALYGGAC